MGTRFFFGAVDAQTQVGATPPTHDIHRHKRTSAA